MNKNPDKFEIFLKASELGNITRTAETLHYSQAGISHAISELEKEFGMALFNRSRRGIELTEEGALLLPLINDIVNRKIALQEQVYTMTHHIRGTLRLGSPASINTSLAPVIIREFTTLYPDVTIDIYDGNFDELHDMLQNGQITCAFLPSTAVKKMKFYHLFDDPLMGVLPPGHPLSNRKHLSLDELLEYPFIMQSKGNDYEIFRLLEGCNSQMKVRYTFDEEISIMSMVAAGLGVCILSHLMLRNATSPLVSLPFHPAQCRAIGIATQPDCSSVVTNVFITFLKTRSDLWEPFLMS